MTEKPALFDVGVKKDPATQLAQDLWPIYDEWHRGESDTAAVLIKAASEIRQHSVLCQEARAHERARIMKWLCEKRDMATVDMWELCRYIHESP